MAKVEDDVGDATSGTMIIKLSMGVLPALRPTAPVNTSHPRSLLNL